MIYMVSRNKINHYFNNEFSNSLKTKSLLWLQNTFIGTESESHAQLCRILQARILEWVAFLFSRGFSQQGIEPRSPVMQADSLPTEL